MSQFYSILNSIHLLSMSSMSMEIVSIFHLEEGLMHSESVFRAEQYLNTLYLNTVFKYIYCIYTLYLNTFFNLYLITVFKYF